MKKLNYILFLLLFYACQKENDIDSTVIEFPKDFTQSFIPTQKIAYNTLDAFVIKLNNNSNIYFIISLSNQSVGNFIISADFFEEGFTDNNNEATFKGTCLCIINNRSYYIKNGDVNITKIENNKISGEFNFSGISNDNLEIPIYIERGIIKDVPVQEINYSSINDFEGNEYKTVQVQDQTWMAENLRSKYYADGTKIENVKVFRNEANNRDKYVYFYNWETVMKGSNLERSQGVCPEGWHIPSFNEWITLSENLGGNYKALPQLLSTVGWGNQLDFYSSNLIDNSSGMTYLKTGYFRSSNNYYYGGFSGFWSSTFDEETNLAYYNNCRYSLYNNNLYIAHSNSDGYSVRCIKD